MESYVAHRIVNPVLYLVQVDVFAAQAEALERLRFPLTANLLLEGDFRADNVLYQQLGAALNSGLMSQTRFSDLSELMRLIGAVTQAEPSGASSRGLWVTVALGLEVGAVRRRGVVAKIMITAQRMTNGMYSYLIFIIVSSVALSPLASECSGVVQSGRADRM